MTLRIFVGVLLILLLAGGMIVLGIRSGMLRDAGRGEISPTYRSFSLARVQMAWWFLIILGSYIYLWILNDSAPAISTDALALMGIASGTSLFSVGLDTIKQPSDATTSGNFFIDLLTDIGGVTLPRFQMLAITIVLGVIFIFYVGTNGAMPSEFDTTTLTLLGFASATYLGFKVPEKQSPAPEPTPTPIPVIAGTGTDGGTGPTLPDDPKAGYTAEPAADQGDPKSAYSPTPA